MELTIEGFNKRIEDEEYINKLLHKFKHKDIIKNYINEYILKHKEVREMGLKIPLDERTKDIHRQVFIKIASEQIKGTPEQLIEFAKKLEGVYNGWN